MGTVPTHRRPSRAVRVTAAVVLSILVVSAPAGAWAHHRPGHGHGPPVEEPSPDPTEEPTSEPTEDPDPTTSDITFWVQYIGLSRVADMWRSCALTVPTGVGQIEILEAARTSGCISSYVAVPNVARLFDGNGEPYAVQCIDGRCAVARVWLGEGLLSVPSAWPAFYYWRSDGGAPTAARDGLVVTLSYHDGLV